MKKKNQFIVGIFAVFTWYKLAVFDIRQRYRRSLIGPWWFTINVAFLIGILGLVYGQVLKQPLREYLPYLAVGLVTWQFISTSLLEACSIFIGSAHLIKQIQLPMMIYVCRSVFRNFLIFLHALPVLFIVLFLSDINFVPSLISVPLAIIFLGLHIVWIAAILGFLCARFRDVIPITANVIQVLFFTTPIVWNSELLAEHRWIADFNPIHHIIECLRDPLLGNDMPIVSWGVSIGVLIVGMWAAAWMVQRYSHRIAYWV